MKIKKYKPLTLVLLSVLAIFIIISVYFAIFNHTINTKEQMQLATIQEDTDSLNSSKLEKAQVEKEMSYQTVLKEIMKKQYDITAFNEFTNQFENEIWQGNFAKQVIYTLQEKQLILTITISIDGDYQSIRNFIYNTEKNYYFLKVKTVSLYTENNSIKGSLVIDAYFKGGLDD